jgi:hypothetical protein
MDVVCKVAYDYRRADAEPADRVIGLTEYSRSELVVKARWFCMTHRCRCLLWNSRNASGGV